MTTASIFTHDDKGNLQLRRPEAWDRRINELELRIAGLEGDVQRLTEVARLRMSAPQYTIAQRLSNAERKSAEQDKQIATLAEHTAALHKRLAAVEAQLRDTDETRGKP